MTTTIERAGKALRQDVRDERRRAIGNYDRGFFFMYAGARAGEHLYGRQLDTLASQRLYWEGDVDFTRMMMEAIRARLWFAKSKSYYVCDTRQLETAYYGELRLWVEQRRAA